MKVYLKKLLIMLAFCLPVLMLGTLSVQVSAMSKTKQHKLYASTKKSYYKKIKKYAKEEDDLMGYTNYYTKRKVYYAYADIDKNGVDELILRYSSGTNYTGVDSGYGESTNIYTIKNGKVKTVLDSIKSGWCPYYHGNYVNIFKGSKYIDRGYAHGYEDCSFFKYSKGKLSKKSIYDLASFDGKYYINSKKVSKSTYRKKMNALTNKQNKGYKMKVYK